MPKLLTALLLLVEGALSPPLQAVEVDTLMKRVDALNAAVQ